MGGSEMRARDNIDVIDLFVAEHRISISVILAVVALMATLYASHGLTLHDALLAAPL